MRSVAPETIYACIKNQAPDGSRRCDVYRTSVDRNSDYRLLDLSENAWKYFDPACAYLTRFAFERNSDPIGIPSGKFDFSVSETREWLIDLDSMQKSLVNYLKTRSNASITDFERSKASLVRFKGIGEFWTAILNIRFNSVPLLNLNEGIKKTLEACRETHGQIHSAISNHEL